MTGGAWIALASVALSFLTIIIGIAWKMSGRLTAQDFSIAGLKADVEKILGILQAASKEKQDELRDRAERAEKAARGRGWGILDGQRGNGRDSSEDD